MCGIDHHHHESWILDKKNLEPTSHHLIIHIKSWNWLTSNFVISYFEIAPKEDDGSIVSNDKGEESGKTRM